MKYYYLVTVVPALSLAGLFFLLADRGAPEVTYSKDGVGPDCPRAQPQADDWPYWRGASGNGISLHASAPLSWAPSEGVAWKVAVPGRGHASPIVSGNRVFLFTADEATGVRSLLCYQRDSGSLLWDTELHRGGIMSCHRKNSQASATPACDGACVFAAYLAEDALWAVAVDLAGRVVWRTRVGPFVSQWGYGSSPVLYENLVIVAGDNKSSRLGQMTGSGSYLAALHRGSGRIVWRARRPRAHSYGSPLVARLAGRDQLVLAGSERITAYDPASGQELWRCRWSAQRVANTVACGPDVVFASAGFPEAELVCIKADGAGDVTDSHVLWRQRKAVPDVPSPLYHAGRLYTVTDKGVAACFDAADGTLIWQQRLGTAFTASPVLAGDRIYATDDEGTTHVFRAGPRFELLARNCLGDTTNASPALTGNFLLLRSAGSLWRLGSRSPAAVARRSTGGETR
jgi:hypothetical protein